MSEQVIVKPRKKKNAFLTFLTNLIFFVSFSILASVLLTMFVFNMKFASVKDDSMEPALPKDSMVLIQDASPAQLKEGDVVQYQLKSGDPQTDFIRVIGVNNNKKDTIMFITQKDSKLDKDVTVLDKQIRGKVFTLVDGGILHLPFMGKLIIK